MSKRLISLCIALLMLISLVACSAGSSPESTINNFFSAVQKGDIKTAATYMLTENGDNNFLSGDEQQQKISSQIFSKISHEIISSTVDGKSAKVETKVTSPDMAKIMGSLVTDLLPTLFSAVLTGQYANTNTNDMVYEYLNKALSDPNTPMLTNNVTIELVKDQKSGKWLIKPSEKFADALTGNMTSAFNSLYQAATDETFSPTSYGNVPDNTLYAVDQEAVYEGAAITVSKVEMSDGMEFYRPKDGMEYAIITIRVRNVGEGNMRYTPYDYRIQNSQGQITDQAFSIIDTQTHLGDGELTSGGSVEGTIVFEVPKGDENLILTFSPYQEALLKFKL